MFDRSGDAHRTSRISAVDSEVFQSGDAFTTSHKGIFAWHELATFKFLSVFFRAAGMFDPQNDLSNTRFPKLVDPRVQ